MCHNISSGRLYNFLCSKILNNVQKNVKFMLQHYCGCFSTINMIWRLALRQLLLFLPRIIRLSAQAPFEKGNPIWYCKEGNPISYCTKYWWVQFAEPKCFQSNPRRTKHRDYDENQSRRALPPGGGRFWSPKIPKKISKKY